MKYVPHFTISGKSGQVMQDQTQSNIHASIDGVRVFGPKGSLIDAKLLLSWLLQGLALVLDIAWICSVPMEIVSPSLEPGPRALIRTIWTRQTIRDTLPQQGTFFRVWFSRTRSKESRDQRGTKLSPRPVG